MKGDEIEDERSSVYQRETQTFALAYCTALPGVLSFVYGPSTLILYGSVFLVSALQLFEISEMPK